MERKYLGEGHGHIDMHSSDDDGLFTLPTTKTPLFSAVEARVAAMIVEHLGVAAARVVKEANFATDLGADSLDMVELVMAAEEDFHIEIADDEAEGLVTVADAMELITAKYHG